DSDLPCLPQPSPVRRNAGNDRSHHRAASATSPVKDRRKEAPPPSRSGAKLLLARRDGWRGVTVPIPAPQFQSSLVNFGSKGGTKISVPHCGIRRTPWGRGPLKTRLLEDLLSFICIAAFVTGIAFAAVTLLG